MATARQIRRQLSRAVEIVAGRIAGDLITDLRDATPKDTSYHSSRWVGRAGGPPASRDTPNSRSGRAAALSFAQQNASVTAVLGFRISQGTIYVSNDGNYIEQLNARAGGGFVQSAVRSVPRRVSLLGTGLTP